MRRLRRVGKVRLNGLWRRVKNGKQEEMNYEKDSRWMHIRG